MGSLCGGMLPALAGSSGTASINGYRAVVIAYAALGMVLTLVFARLSSATEVGASEDHSSSLAAKKTLLGIGHSREIVFMPIGTVRPGLLWRRFRRSEFRSLLVLPAFRRETGHARCDLLWSEYICRDFRASGIPPRIPVWTGEDDGLYPSSFEHSALFCCRLCLRFSQMDVRRGSPTRWPSFIPKSDLPRPALRAWREQSVPQSRRCLSGSCSPTRA